MNKLYACIMNVQQNTVKLCFCIPNVRTHNVHEKSMFLLHNLCLATDKKKY